MEPVKASISVAPSAGIRSALRLDIWKTPFRSTMLVLLLFHLAQYLPTPVYPLYNVRVLNLNDSHIGTGTSLFYLTVLIGSTQLKNLASRLGNKKTTGIGAAGIAFYPFMLALSHNIWQFYLTSLLGGFFFAVVNGSYINYMLEKIPPDDRPSHLAWYTIILNIAILGSSLLGPALAEWTGLVGALIVFGALRLLSGLILLRWG